MITTKAETVQQRLTSSIIRKLISKYGFFYHTSDQRPEVLKITVMINGPEKVTYFYIIKCI